MATKADSSVGFYEVDLTGGFDVVLLPQGSTDPGLVVGKIAPGSLGVVVNTYAVQRAKRWLRAKGTTIVIASAGELRPRIETYRGKKTDVLHGLRTRQKQAAVERNAKQIYTSLVKTMAALDTKQDSFRVDLQAAIAEGEMQLKDVAG